MRFLLTMQPLTGHFHSLMPVAIALRDAGHQVAFATGASFAAQVERAGFASFACGLDFDSATNALPALPEWPEICARVEHPALQQLTGFIEGMSARMADDLLPVMAEWQPHLIVREPVEYGGYIAAEVCGLRHAAVMWGTYIDARHLCADSLHGLRARYKLRPDPELDSIDRDLVLKFLPDWWKFDDLAEPASTRCFCAAPWDHAGDVTLPNWVSELADRPLVYATLGTTFNQAPETFRAIIDALADGPCNGIVTVGTNVDPQSLGTLPANVRAERYVPQSLILPHCAALVFHGGYNSLFSGLWHGLPMVVTPLEGGDQWPTALLCAEKGVGLHVEGSPPKVNQLRDAIGAVVSEPAFHERAQEVAAEIRRLPPIGEAVSPLMALANA